MNYKIRLASLDDVGELTILKQQMWDETYRGIYDDHLIDDFDYKKAEVSFSKKVVDDKLTFYVVVANNKIVGYIVFGFPYRGCKDYKQDISILYLLKKYQRQGIGKQLFNIAYKKMKEEGYDKFFISCNKYNHNARIFYEKMGGQLIEEDDDNPDKSKVQVKYHYDLK